MKVGIIGNFNGSQLQVNKHKQSKANSQTSFKALHINPDDFKAIKDQDIINYLAEAVPELKKLAEKVKMVILPTGVGTALEGLEIKISRLTGIQEGTPAKEEKVVSKMTMATLSDTIIRRAKEAIEEFNGKPPVNLDGLKAALES